VTKGPALLDTGPLVSFLASGLRHHAWAVEQWKRLRPPLLTCEPVLTEAAYLLKRERREADAIFALLERGVIRIALTLQEEQADLRALMRRYRNRPMSLADACLVRLSEIHATGEVFTLDSDFRIYRRHGNKVIPVLMPESSSPPRRY
jgi:predicted nucleic acid-binding protein